MKKGMTFEPNRATEKVLVAIASIESEEFGIADVAEHCPDLSSKQVQGILSYEVHRKALDRVRYGRYRKGGLRIKTRLPNSLGVDAVWAVLVTSPDRHPLPLIEIVGEAESYLGRPGLSVYSTVSSILNTWHRDGYIDRFGDRKPYCYALKTGISERPLCTHNT